MSMVQFPKYDPDEASGILDTNSNTTALDIIQVTEAANRAALRKEIEEFVAHMKQREFPGVRRIEVTVGHKKGLRWLLVPKYAKEEYADIAGWTLYANESEAWKNEDLTKINPFLCGITADGELLEEYVWTEIWIPGIKKAKPIDEMSASTVNDYRYYLSELLKKYG